MPNIEKSFQGKSLILVFEKEVDGQIKRIRKTFKHISQDAEDNVIYSVAKSIGEFYDAALVDVLIDVDYRLDEPEN